MATAGKLKQINMEKVRSEMKSLNHHTKNSLSDATGLSVATCGNVLKDMVEIGEVFEIEPAESTGGRPSRQFIYNKNFSCVLTIYLRKEKENKSIYYGVSNIAGEIIFEELIENSDGDISDVDEIVESALKRNKNIKVLALGIPGIIKDGEIGYCCFEAFTNFDIVAHYENLYDIDVVAINDVNCIALGFHRMKMCAREESVVYIYYPLDSCPGSGIIIDGKVLNGISNFAGEIGNLPHYIFNSESKGISVDFSDFEDDVLLTIISVNSLINPKTIVLSGCDFDNEIIDNIKKAAKEYIPDVHMPEIAYEEDIHKSYVGGLTAIALEQLVYNFKI